MRSFVYVLAVLGSSSPAVADVTKVAIADGSRATLSSAYRKDNEVRVFASGDRSAFPTELMRASVVRIAEMTIARGLPRFAVTKVSDCGTMRMNNTPVYTTCRLLGRMLAEGEVAKPEGKREITYFRAGDVLAGQFAPEQPMSKVEF